MHHFEAVAGCERGRRVVGAPHDGAVALHRDGARIAEPLGAPKLMQAEKREIRSVRHDLERPRRRPKR